MMLQNVTGRFWGKRNPRFLVMLLAVLLSAPAVPDIAQADPNVTHNETMIDETSDDMLNSDVNSSDKDDYGFTIVSDSLRYSSEKQMYVYSLSNYEEENIYSTVCDGMMVNDSVSIEVDDGLKTVLYCDEEEVKDADLTSISDAGVYNLYAGVGNTSPKSIFTFTIIGASSNIYTYTVPDNFTITSVILDGADTAKTYSTVNTTEEGEYLISYKCVPVGVENSIRVTIDHTPPTLKLEGVKDGKAHQAVDISDVEDGSTMLITKDGSDIGQQTTLADYGRYKIILEDAAGNRTEYSFKVMVYFTSGTYAFVIVLLLVAAGVAFYIWYSKTHFRVR